MSTYYGVMPVDARDTRFFTEELAAWQAITPQEELSIGFGVLYPAWSSAQCERVPTGMERGKAGGSGNNQTACLELAVADCIARGIRSVMLFQVDVFGWPQVINGRPYATIAAPWPPASWWPVLRRLRG